MPTLLRAFCLATLLTQAPIAAALDIGAAELRASRALSCVLADDALGYLGEEQFNRRFDAVVEGFNEASVDVIYAKALGYIDGLLFGVSGDERQLAMSRLRDLSDSRACRGTTRVGLSL